jgi:single-strand DNA-binding protein
MRPSGRIHDPRRHPVSVNINSVVLIGRLTRDPEAGGRRCMLRLAVNERRKVAGTEDEWADRPNFFDVVTWGPLAQTCAAHLMKGRLVAVSGSLSFHEWDAGEGKPRGRKVEIVADTVSFLDAPPVRAVAPAEPEHALAPTVPDDVAGTVAGPTPEPAAEPAPARAA